MATIEMQIKRIDSLSHKVATGGREDSITADRPSQGNENPALQGPGGVSGSQEGLPPNNNTPVKAGVLWGCIDRVGESVADAPAVDDLQQVEHIGGAIAVQVAAV